MAISGAARYWELPFVARPLSKGLGAAALAALGFGNVFMTCVFSCVEEVASVGASLLLLSR